MDLVENSNLGSEQNRHPWELSRYTIIKEKVRGIIQKNHHIQNTIIVDIGCGDAYVISRLSNELKELNSDSFFGVDINFTPEMISNYEISGGTVKLFQDIQNIQVDPAKEYVILLNDVIEHVEFHNEFLRSISQKFESSKGTSIFITVPAFENLFSNHDVDLGHYRRYTCDDLQKYSEIAGMNIQASGYFFFSLFLARAILKKFEGPVDRNRVGIGVSAWTGGFLKTKLMQSVLLLDYFILKPFNAIGIRIPGLSAFTIYSRK